MINQRFVKRKRINLTTPPLVDYTRDLVAKLETKKIAYDINDPRTPITCSGTSFQCKVAGSGKTPIINLQTKPTQSDILATDITEAGISGATFQPDFILNWSNNSIETKYTKDSLRNTYGFENFQ